MINNTYTKLYTSVVAKNNPKNPDNKRRSSSLGFNGLNSAFSSKSFENPDNIAVIRNCYEKSLGVVGNIAHDWIKEIPKAERESKIKSLYKAFDNIAEHFRRGSKKTKYTFRGHKFDAINPSEETLKQANRILGAAFKKAGIPVNEKIKLKELDSGLFGCAFKFNINGTDYVLKVYHELDSSLKNYIIGRHGSFFENNSAQFINANGGKDHQFAKFFFGNIKSGYIVEKFVSNEEKVKRIISLRAMGLNDSKDSIGNTSYGGIIYDYGGITVRYKKASNSKDERYKLKKAIIAENEEWIDEYRKAKNLTYDDPKKQNLIDCLYRLPDQIRLKAFLLMATDTEAAPRIIRIGFRYLSEKDSFTAFKTLLKKEDIGIKFALIEEITRLPKVDYFEAFKMLAKDKDKKVRTCLKIEASQAFKKFIDKDRFEAFKILVELNKVNDKLTKKAIEELSYKLAYIPSKELPEANKLLSRFQNR